MVCVTSTMPLSDLAFVQVGHALRNSIPDERKGSIAMIQMRDAKPQSLAHPESLTRISLPRVPKRHLLQAGDLVFRARGATHHAWVITPPETPTICLAPLVRIHIHDQSCLLPAYLQWFINLNETQQTLARFSHVNRNHTVGTKALKDLEVVLPDIERQQKIVEAHALEVRIEELEAELRRKRLQYTENALLKYAKE
jgi:hypothetical protein